MSSDIGRDPKEYVDFKIKNGSITKRDGNLILKFITDRKMTANIMPHTQASYSRYLARALELINKPIKEWDYGTFTTFSEMVKGQYKPNTYRKHINCMKIFLLYLIENKIVISIKKDQVTRVNLPRRDMMTKKAGDMLSTEEVKAIIGNTKNSRDRAIISIIFESGCRPTEILSLEWEDVNFDKYGCTLNTAKKTGKPRRIRIIHMAEYLRIWKNDYPDTPEGHAPVFVNLDTSEGHHKITRGALRKILQKAVKGSGITKRVHPYLFRHSRVTDMLSQGIPTSVIGLQFWGSLDSQMLKTYGHLSDQQTDDILLKYSGIVPEEKKISELKPVSCPACGKSNPAGLKYCGTCGSVLDPAEYQKRIQESPEALMERMKKQMALLDSILKSNKYDVLPKTLPSGEEIYDIVEKL